MSAPTVQPPKQNQHRWLTLALIIFSLQLSLVWLMGERWQSAPPSRVSPPVGFLPKPLSDNQIAATIFASHPTVFPEPSQQGFSGRAWLHGSTQTYTTPEREEPDHSLPLAADRLAVHLPSISPERSSIPFELAAQTDPPLEIAMMNLPPETVRSNSTIRLEGPLVARQLSLPSTLPVWHFAQPAANSVVQIAVNGAGEVISTRLASRSGLNAADDAAMEQARNLRFRPAGKVFSAPVWGKVIFDWVTLPMTNTVNVQ